MLCLRHVRNKIVYHIFLTTSAGTPLPTTQLVQNVKLRELHHLPQKATGSLLPNQWESEDEKFSGILVSAAHPILLCLCTPCRRQHNWVAIKDMVSIYPQSDIFHCAIQIYTPLYSVPLHAARAAQYRLYQLGVMNGTHWQETEGVRRGRPGYLFSGPTRCQIARVWLLHHQRSQLLSNVPCIQPLHLGSSNKLYPSGLEVAKQSKHPCIKHP